VRSQVEIPQGPPYKKGTTMMLRFQEWGPWILDHTFTDVHLTDREEGYHVFTDEITETHEVYKRIDPESKEVQYKTILKKVSRRTVGSGRLTFG
jgi:hypothetical protein